MSRKLIIITLMMLSNVALCQSLQKKDSIKISSQERDSIVSKLMHRKALMFKTSELEKALQYCDSAKVIQSSMISSFRLNESNYNSIIESLNNDKADLMKVIANNNIQIQNEKKIGRRKGFWNFIKGAFIGGGVVGILVLTK